ncbi:MAG: hypothetical protein AB7L70_19130 [Pyrinomonadaceae bacterium]
MPGFATYNNDHLIRSSIWSSQLKEALEFDLMGVKYVDMIEEFTDGTTINIPSIGQAEIDDYVEGNPVKYTAMDTGNFQFSITDYKQSGTFITNKMKQDTYYLDRLVSSFVPKQNRAIMADIETKVMAIGPDGQTPSDLNNINGAPHRFLGQGGGSANLISPNDFALAKYSLQKAAVPMTNLVAIVDPSVEYQLSTLTNLVNVSNNPHWEGIVRDGMSTGMKFLMNVYGFDVYVSNFLKSGYTETISGQSTSNGVANLFFSASSDILPFVGQIRQAPRVDSEYNKDMQREEYVTTARYGFKLFRPENLVTVITEGGSIAPAYS